MRLVIRSVEHDGALIHFKDSETGLVREKEQSITREWVVGDRLDVSVADPPVFRLESLDTGEVAHVLLYQDNQPIIDLLDDGD